MALKQQVSEVQIDYLSPIGKYLWMNKSIYNIFKVSFKDLILKPKYHR